jgi:hypothetical protein
MTECRSKIIEAIGGALGTLILLTAVGWPSSASETAWLGLAGLIAGLTVVLGAEYVMHLRAEVVRLKDIEKQSSRDRVHREDERRLWEYRIDVAKRESAINATGLKTFGGAFAEAMTTGNFLPVEAIMARQEVEMRAANLHVPLSPPKVGTATNAMPER